MDIGGLVFGALGDILNTYRSSPSGTGCTHSVSPPPESRLRAGILLFKLVAHLTNIGQHIVL